MSNSGAYKNAEAVQGHMYGVALVCAERPSSEVERGVGPPGRWLKRRLELWLRMGRTMDGLGRIVYPRLPGDDRVSRDVEYGQILAGDNRAAIVRADLLEHAVNTWTDRISPPQAAGFEPWR